jgi:hypothetical protein
MSEYLIVPGCGGIVVDLLGHFLISPLVDCGGRDSLLHPGLLFIQDCRH